MAQHDYDIANGSGSAVRADINAVLDAVVSNNSGTSAPSTTFPYMFWADTTTGILKMRNASNTGWVNVQNIDGTLLDGSVTDAKLRDSAALSVIGRSANTSGDPADIAAANDGEVLRRSGTTLGFGTIATAGIANNAVDNTKIRQGAALSVIGVTGNATANVADIAAGTDGFVLRRSGTALAFGTVATAGIADAAVTRAKLANGVALSVIGRSANSAGVPADIAATAASGAVLRESGSVIGFGTVATAGIADDAITNAKLGNMTANTIKGRVTASTGDPEDLSASQVKTILALVKGDVGLGNVDNTSDATKNAATATLTNKTIDGASNTITNLGTATLSNNSVTNAKLAQVATSTIKGRLTAATGDVEDLTAANVKTILALTSADVGLGNVDNTSDATKWAATATLTNKTISGASNTITNLGTSTLSDNAVTNAKLNDMVANTIKGRVTASTGDPEDLSASQVKTILALVKGDVGLGNVDNTSDATKWAATATLTNKTFNANGTGNVLQNVEIGDFAATSTALSVMGRSANTTGAPADIAAANDGEVLRRSGTAIGFGTIATAGIAANAVTNAKLAQIATNTIKGRVTAATGDVEDLSASQVKTILALVKGDVGLGNVDNTSDATKNSATATLTNKTIDGASNTITNLAVSMFAGSAIVTAAEGIASSDNDTSIPTTATVIDAIASAVASGVADGDKGDLTVSGGGLTWTVDANAISNAKFRQSAGLSLVGRSANTTGDVADITAANDGEVLRRSGTAIGFGTIATAGIADDAITNAKLGNMATNTIKGRVTGSTGDPEDLSASQVKTILALVKGDVGLGNVDNTSDATKFDDIAGRIRGRNRQTGTTYTFVLGDAGKLVEGNNASAQTYTVPPNSTTAFPVDTTVINVGQYGAGQITIAAGSGVTIRSSGSKLKLSGQYSTAALVKIGTDEWWLFGDIAA